MRTRDRSLLTIAVTLLAATVLVGPSSPAAAESVSGHGTGISKIVDVSALTARSAVRRSVSAPGSVGAPVGAALPAAPSTGSRPAAKAPAASGPNTRAGAALAPAVAPSVTANFDGADEAIACGACQPPDVTAAAGGTEIAELVNLRLQVFTKTGTAMCDLNLTDFLGTSDVLAHPRIQYDNVNARYSFSVSVLPVSTDDFAAIWVGATTNDEACGVWRVTRITFSGSSFPAGTRLDFPILGQDRNALLMSTDNVTPTGENFTVFGISKAAVYAGDVLNFPTFTTSVRTAPVSNGGIPMIATSSSYFLGSIPGTGYRLYRMAGSATPTATVTLVGTAFASFSAPSRRVNQPGTTVTLDPLDGRITSSPVSDGTFIWFAHGVSLSGFPTVRYGALSISSGATTVAVAYHSSTSDDFNPSIGVGNNPGGGNFVYVNWAYTDTPNGVAVSDTVDSVSPGAGVPSLIGTGTVLAQGASTTETRFGSYSSVAIDPTVAAGGCAVAAQQYFAAGGTWRTRIARLGRC